jgi:hypothetical protein
LNATNWVSSTPFSDFLQNANGISNGTYTPCPIDTPYYNGMQCINCPSGQYFNITSNVCVFCPYNTAYDLTAKKCAPNTPTYATNLNTSPKILYDDYPPALWKSWWTGNATAYGTQDCPPSTPYWNDEQCITCGNTYPYFDLSMKDCVTCPTNYVYQNSQCMNTATNQLSPSLASLAATAFTHQAYDLYQHNFRHRIN